MKYVLIVLFAQMFPILSIFAKEPQVINFAKKMNSMQYIKINEKKISIFFSSIVSNIDSCEFAKSDSKVKAEYAILLSSLFLSKNNLNLEKKLEGLKKYQSNIELCNKNQIIYFNDNQFIKLLRTIADRSIGEYHLNFNDFFEKIKKANLSFVPNEIVREYCNSLKRVGRSLASIECFNGLIGNILVESEKIEIAKELFYAVNDQQLCEINTDFFDSMKLKESSKSLLKEYTKLVNLICNKSINSELYQEGIKKIEFYLSEDNLFDNWEYELKYIDLSYSILTSKKEKINSIFNYFLSKSNIDDGERGYYHYLKSMYELSIGDFTASKKSISNLTKVQNKYISLSTKIMFASCLIDYVTNDGSFELCKKNFFDYTHDSKLGTRYLVYNKIGNLLKMNKYDVLKKELASAIQNHPGILEIYVNSDILKLIKK